MIDHQAMRRAYLLEIAHRLRGPGSERILERAGVLIGKWEASAGVNPRYITRWRRILAGGADAVEQIARSNTPEAEELRHCMPFAGILSNREKQLLRANTDTH